MLNLYKIYLLLILGDTRMNKKIIVLYALFFVNIPQLIHSAAATISVARPRTMSQSESMPTEPRPVHCTKAYSITGNSIAIVGQHITEQDAKRGNDTAPLTAEQAAKGLHDTAIPRSVTPPQETDITKVFFSVHRGAHQSRIDTATSQLKKGYITTFALSIATILGLTGTTIPHKYRNQKYKDYGLYISSTLGVIALLVYIFKVRTLNKQIYDLNEQSKKFVTRQELESRYNITVPQDDNSQLFSLDESRTARLQSALGDTTLVIQGPATDNPPHINPDVDHIVGEFDKNTHSSSGDDSHDDDGHEVLHTGPAS